MTKKTDTNSKKTDNNDFMKNYDSSETQKKREKEERRKLADEIIHTASGREVSDLKNDTVS